MRRRVKVTLGCLVVAGGLLGAGVALGGVAGARTAMRYGHSPHTRFAPLIDRLRPTPSFDNPAPDPATPAAARVLATLERVERRTRRTSYQHRTRVREARGEYHWDCSGMAGWILAQSAPRARRSLGQGRPVARTFARRIARARTDRPRRGWQRVEHIADARPGDVFAWERPPDFPSNNTGHVGFVVNRPVRVTDDLFAVRILDSTSLAHQDDTRSAGESGTGRGTMTFVTDGEGHATAYGWRGLSSLGHIETDVVFGRVH